MQQNISKLTFVVQMSFATTLLAFAIRFMIYFLLCFVFFENFTILFFPLPSKNSSLVGFYRALITINNVQLALIKPVVPRIVCFYVLSSVGVWVSGRRTASGTLLRLTQGCPLVMCDCRMLWRTAEA